MNEELDRFEKTLEEGLVKICSMAGLADEVMMSPDIDGKWNEFIKDYVADAVMNFNEYPDAAVGFAAFLGMAVAHHWDSDWQANRLNTYKKYYGKRGFDDMDDHITGDILNLTLEESLKISGTINNCVQAALGLIRHEGIEAQTVTGFYALARCYSVLFRIGVSIELKRLGYKKQSIR